MKDETEETNRIRIDAPYYCRFRMVGHMAHAGWNPEVLERDPADGRGLPSETPARQGQKKAGPLHGPASV